MSYECHITVTVADAKAATVIADCMGWKTSEIKRDPTLGDGSHFYLTAHSPDMPRLRGKMEETSLKLAEAGCKVLREKIEHIVYDTKTGIGLVF